ncbi:hypothetical protein SYK_15650 [Pseudodesulfovibrio nedwellii]|uniref:Uncharacterized protein n=1 Tax=Pseudodesulfovibrio nedwellii TaxID=2973072 RepID=A0ABN6S482_9BACT|nr:hypothetical protein [Pseudodesulfovibrio nedwellii]BDQ37205.1 hypothetical protein SYK_15650 [Pseudodesulfovibrio nedwellii]
MKITWELPELRSGFYGVLDKFIGPRATSAEKKLQLYIPLLAGIVVILKSYSSQFNWSVGQQVVAFLITFDIAGGIITNSTSSAKRWFHREGQGFKSHMSFVLLHFSQIFLINIFFMDFDFIWIAAAGCYLVLACALVLCTPLYLQRTMALMLYSVGVLLSLYVFSAPVHLEWFLPLLYLKLLVSHIVREEPYRPENE